MTTKNNGMFRNELVTKFVKVMSATLVVCMLVFSMTACGTVSQQDVRPTTEYSTEEVGNNDQNEPIAPIDDGYWHDDPTEEPTSEEPSTTEPTPSQSGAYTYTVYGDIQLSMDVNIDDWIDTNSSGQEFFKYDRLAQSLGWLPENQDLASFGDGTAAFYTYQTGDMTVVFRLYGSDSWGNAPGYNHPQIYGIEYFFGENDDLERRYYFGEENLADEDKYSVVNFQQHNDDIEYLVAGRYSVMASRDDIIVIAYMLSNVTRNAEKNPFVNTELMRYCNSNAGISIDFLLP